MSEIKITINGTTHTFNNGDEPSVKDMPWSDRKKLIDLLERIKQAEYIKKPELNEQSPDKQTTSDGDQLKADQIRQRLKQAKANKTNIPPKNVMPSLDPSIKASENDVSDLMNRLILEEKQHHKPVPDKSMVVKLFLVIFVVIILLAVLF